MWIITESYICLTVRTNYIQCLSRVLCYGASVTNRIDAIPTHTQLRAYEERARGILQRAATVKWVSVTAGRQCPKESHSSTYTEADFPGRTPSETWPLRQSSRQREKGSRDWRRVSGQHVSARKARVGIERGRKTGSERGPIWRALRSHRRESGLDKSKLRINFVLLSLYWTCFRQEISHITYTVNLCSLWINYQQHLPVSRELMSLTRVSP